MTTAPAHHPAAIAYLDALYAAGKASTAKTYGGYLLTFERWAQANRVDLLRATTDQLAGYQLWLAQDRTVRTGQVRARTTQGTALTIVQSFYGWMQRRNLIVHDPAEALVPPRQTGRCMVRKDHLTLQEATALIQTQAAIVEERPGPRRRAQEIRNLALLAVALATGRRVHGLIDLRVDQVDLERNELRVEREKGHAGRVLPVAPWAMATVRRYLSEARPLLVRDVRHPWLFISQMPTGKLCKRAVGEVLEVAVAETVRRNPDLAELPQKRITSHSLRVSFATLLFQGGCNIRSINELMLHQDLSTTAQYTPMRMADLRRILLTTHPRA